MIQKETFRYGLYAAAVTIVVALTAAFGKFQRLSVIDRQVSLSYVVLAVILIGVGYLTSSFARNGRITPLLVNGLVGSLIVGLALILLILIEANIDLTFVFPDLTTDSIAPVLTFGQELLPGCILLLIISGLFGMAGAWLHILPRRPLRVVLLSLSIIAVIGLLDNQLNTVITLHDSLALALVFGVGYLASLRFSSPNIRARPTAV